MEEVSISERLLPVATLAVGFCLPYMVNAVVELIDGLRPGKKLDATNEKLERIANKLEGLPSSDSLTQLTGQVEKLERILSRRHKAEKTKATPEHVVKHINGAA